MNKRTNVFIEFNKELDGLENLFMDILFGRTKSDAYSISNPIEKNVVMSEERKKRIWVEVIETEGLFLTGAEQYVHNPHSPEVFQEYKEIIVRKNAEMLREMMELAKEFNDDSIKELEEASVAFSELINEYNEIIFAPARTTIKFSILDSALDSNDLDSIHSAILVLKENVLDVELKKVTCEVIEVKNMVLFDK